MKKFVVIVIAITMVLCGVIVIHTAKVNKTRYYVEAYCEQDNGELVFTFCGQDFVWELGAGDKIPNGHHVVLLMGNNETEGFLEDDIIISYK